MQQALAHKEKLNEAVRTLSPSLGMTIPTLKDSSVKVQQRIQDIFHYLGALASIADGESARRISKVIRELLAMLTMMQGDDDLFLGELMIRYWLTVINSAVIRLDEKGRLKVGFDFEPTSGKFKALFSRGSSN